MGKSGGGYKGILSMGSAVVFAILLLLSPCSVRNSLEESLGLKTSSVSNKSKSAEVNYYNCDDNEDLHDAELVVDFPAFFFQSSSKLLQEPAVKDPYATLLEKKADEGIKIPLYIIYKSLKLHL